MSEKRGTHRVASGQRCSSASHNATTTNARPPTHIAAANTWAMSETDASVPVGVCRAGNRGRPQGAGREEPRRDRRRLTAGHSRPPEHESGREQAESKACADELDLAVTGSGDVRHVVPREGIAEAAAGGLRALQRKAEQRPHREGSGRYGQQAQEAPVETRVRASESEDEGRDAPGAEEEQD